MKQELTFVEVGNHDNIYYEIHGYEKTRFGNIRHGRIGTLDYDYSLGTYYVHMDDGNNSEGCMKQILEKIDELRKIKWHNQWDD